MSISLVHADSVAGNSISIPAHEAGDLLLIYATRNSGQAGLPSGWEEIEYLLGGNVGGRLMKKTTTDGSAGSVSSSAASSIILLIYRGAEIGAHDHAGTSTQTTLAVPALELENTDGSSWVAVFGHRSSTQVYDDFVPTSGSATLTIREQAPVSNQYLALDTNGGVSSWPGGALTFESADNRSGIAIAVELKDLSSAPTGPTLTSGAATDITGDGVTLGASTNTGEGDAWYVIVERDADAPDAEQIKAGTDANDDPAAAAGTREIDATGPFLFDPAEGLEPATQYDAYIYQEDEAEEGSNILKVQFGTLANTIQWSVEPAVDEVGVGSVTITATPDRACEVHAIALAAGATDVTLASSVCEGEDGDGEPAAAHDYDTSDGSEVTLTLSGLTDPVYDIRVAARIPDPEE